jgi:predicted flap endonuclease-1-like 5' DNA nuclease
LVKFIPKQTPHGREQHLMEGKIMANVKEIEGIGPSYAEKLKTVGVTTIPSLLKKGSTSQDRKELVEATGINGDMLLKWVNHADLIRIKGVGPEYAELLEAAGVDSVPELAQRVPQNLHQKMLECNTEKKLVRRPPALSQVKSWVKQAQKLPRVITY